MNRSYLIQRAGLRPYRNINGVWEIAIPGEFVAISEKVKERDAFQELYDQFWNYRREQALERDRYRCRLCSSPSSLSVDHIRSRGAGGTDDMSNLRVLCVKCHDRRHNG